MSTALRLHVRADPSLEKVEIASCTRRGGWFDRHLTYEKNSQKISI